MTMLASLEKKKALGPCLTRLFQRILNEDMLTDRAKPWSWRTRDHQVSAAVIPGLSHPLARPSGSWKTLSTACVGIMLQRFMLTSRDLGGFLKNPPSQNPLSSLLAPVLTEKEMAEFESHCSWAGVYKGYYERATVPPRDTASLTNNCQAWWPLTAIPGIRKPKQEDC